MTVVYALQEFPKETTKSIFLAGPTPRTQNVQSWRQEALNLLKANGYDGIVIVPEPEDSNFKREYTKQIDWETEGLNRADCILFWIPRNMKDMPALTTNIEWGKYQRSEKIVMGFPMDSEHNSYIKYECDSLGIQVNSTLEETAKYAIDFIGDGSYRKDGECYVPLNIWKTDMFQKWYKAQIACGNVLTYAKVNYVFKMPIMKKIFLWILHVNVYIPSEDRIKSNEFIISRTDISSVVIYKKDKENILNSKIVLIKEFRSPVNNDEGMVYEIPGGSSIVDKDALETIASEIKEETGLEFNKNRLIFEGARQLMSTLSSHKCYLYSLEISNDELDSIMKQVDSVHGVIEDTEITYLKVYSVSELLEKNIVDWSNLGYILSVLNKN